jgi:hypothetical protein
MLFNYVAGFGMACVAAFDGVLEGCWHLLRVHGFGKYKPSREECSC